jgi:hypothetical protein
MRQPAVAPVHHQHDSGLQPRCCDNWPPAGRVRTVGSILNRSQLIHTATYTARLLAALGAVIAVHTLLLPATTAWAGAHGTTGWALWLIWAAGSLAALHQGVLARRRSRTAVHTLHALTVTAVLMGIAAPGGWAQALTAAAGAAVAWLIAMHATRR